MFRKPEPEIVGIKEVLAEFHPPREYFLRPLVFPGSLMMLYAPSGLGKSLVMNSMAMAVASCGTFLKWKAERPGRVWHIEQEMPKDTVQRRLLKANPDGLTQVTSDNYRITRLNYELPQICISNPLQHKWVLDKAKNFDFIILDNYGCLTQQNGSESDVSVWARVKPLLLKLRSLGKSVCLVHHAGKSDDYLGTSQLTQPLDWVVKLSKLPDAIPGEGANFKLQFQKERDGWGEDLSPIVVNLRDSQNGFVWEWRGERDDLARQVNDRRALGMTDHQIGKELGVWLSKVKSVPKDTQIDETDFGSGGFTYDNDEMF